MQIYYFERKNGLLMTSSANVRKIEGDCYMIVSWQNITTGGPQSLTINVDKAAVANAGKTILEVKFLPPRGQQTFPRNTTPIIDRPWLTNTTLVPENRVVTVCDEKDQYRFGWNTHEKVNEIAGIGNHTTALFGEFDTRLGRRWNRDPKSGLMPNESPYAVNHGNPIAYKDPKGDFGFIGAVIGAVAGAVIEYGSQAASNLIQGKSLKDALWNEIDFADVGVSAAEGALAGTTGGASLIVTRVTAGAVRASVDYTPEKKWRYMGGEGKNKKTSKEFLLDAGSELVGGAVGAGFDKAGLKEFVRKPPRSLFKGGVKQARKALGDEIATGTVETAIPTIIDGAVRGSVEADAPIPVGYEDPDTKEFVPYNTPSQTQEK